MRRSCNAAIEFGRQRTVMNPFPGFATFGTAGFTADASSFSFKEAYVKGLANRHFAGIPNRNSIAALHESTHL